MRIFLVGLVLWAGAACASQVQYPNKNVAPPPAGPVLTGERYALVRAAPAGASVQLHAAVRSIEANNVIVAASSPVAATVEWHRLVAGMEQRIDMTTAKTQPIELGARQFLVLCDLREPLRAGAVFPVTLTFDHGLPATLLVRVIP